MSESLDLMPTLEIVQLGDPVLRENAPAWRAPEDPEQLLELVELMRNTMLKAPGVGLAAPQIGLALRLAVLEDQWPVDPDSAREREREPLPFFVAIDPSYRPLTDRTVTHYEGCLSMRGYTAAVERHIDIEARWLDLAGQEHGEELHGWQARIFQHETDHVNGTLYIDKAITRSLSTDANFSMLWAGSPLEQVKDALNF